VRRERTGLARGEVDEHELVVEVGALLLHDEAGAVGRKRDGGAAAGGLHHTPRFTLADGTDVDVEVARVALVGREGNLPTVVGEGAKHGLHARGREGHELGAGGERAEDLGVFVAAYVAAREDEAPVCAVVHPLHALGGLDEACASRVRA
jgi:hypothetical protein